MITNTILTPSNTIPTQAMNMTITAIMMAMMIVSMLQLILHHHHTLNFFQNHLQMLEQSLEQSTPSSPLSTRYEGDTL